MAFIYDHIREFIFLLVYCHVTLGTDWFEEPYGDDSFNIRAEFNTNVTLVCNDSRATVATEFRYWIAPDLTIMMQNYSYEFRTLDGMAGWKVSEDGYEVYAYLIHEAHFGFYYCVLEDPSDSSNVHIIKRSINFQGPYFGDLWVKYEMPTIVGLSASGAFLAVVIIIFVTWHFRFESADSNEENYQRSAIEEYTDLKRSALNNQPVSYDNAAYEPIQGVGFSPVSPIDVKQVVGESSPSFNQTSTVL